jgi:hypothetical protein
MGKLYFDAWSEIRPFLSEIFCKWKGEAFIFKIKFAPPSKAWSIALLCQISSQTVRATLVWLTSKIPESVPGTKYLYSSKTS